MAEILIQRKRRRSLWPWLLGLLLLALIPLPFLGKRERAPVNTIATTRRDTARADTGRTRDTAAAVAGGNVTAAAAPTGVRTGGAAGGDRTTATAAGSIAPTENARPRAASAAPTGGAPANAAPKATTEAIAGSFATFTARGGPAAERAHLEYTAEALRRLADELLALGASERGLSVIRVHADSLQMANARRAARPDYVRAAFLGAVREIDLLRQQQGARVAVTRLRSSAWAIDPRRPLSAQRATVDRFFAAARNALNALSRRA